MRRPLTIAAAAPVLAALLLLALAACGGDATAGGDAASPDGGDGPQRWSLGEPTLAIGVQEGEDAYQLHQVSDATLLPDGRVALTNAGTQEVRVFDPDGRFLVAQGRQGDGPGEWQRPTAVHAVGGDSLAVVDGWSGRVGFVDAGTGDFLGTADPATAGRYLPPLLFHAGLLVEGVEADRAGILAPVLAELDATSPAAPARVRVGKGGEVWVEQAPSVRDRRLVLMDLEGATRATLELPPGFTPLEVGEEHVLGVIRDSLNVEYLERRPLRGRSPLELPALPAAGGAEERGGPLPDRSVRADEVTGLREAFMAVASAQEMFYAAGNGRYTDDVSRLEVRGEPVELPEALEVQILEAGPTGWMGRFVKPAEGAGCFLAYGRFRLPEGVAPGETVCWGPPAPASQVAGEG